MRSSNAVLASVVTGMICTTASGLIMWLVMSHKIADAQERALAAREEAVEARGEADAARQEVATAGTLQAMARLRTLRDMGVTRSDAEEFFKELATADGGNAETVQVGRTLVEFVWGEEKERTGGGNNPVGGK